MGVAMEPVHFLGPIQAFDRADILAGGFQRQTSGNGWLSYVFQAMT